MKQNPTNARAQHVDQVDWRKTTAISNCRHLKTHWETLSFQTFPDILRSRARNMLQDIMIPRCALRLYRWVSECDQSGWENVLRTAQLPNCTRPSKTACRLIEMYIQQLHRFTPYFLEIHFNFILVNLSFGKCSHPIEKNTFQKAIGWAKINNIQYDPEWVSNNSGYDQAWKITKFHKYKCS